MSNLSGQKATDFILWLNKIRELLPPQMLISDAQKIWELKISQEEQLQGEKTENEKDVC